MVSLKFMILCVGITASISACMARTIGHERDWETLVAQHSRVERSADEIGLVRKTEATRVDSTPNNSGMPFLDMV